jgi:hypothetical protein
MMNFLQKKIELHFNQAGEVLGEFRRYCAETTGKKGGPTRPTDWVMPPQEG